jgi:PTS system nitrogen regulatory IIA component
MDLGDVLQESCIVVGADLGDKHEVLHEVARAARHHAALEDVTTADLVEALAGRERLGTTGLGRGIAIPHCHLEGASDFVVGLITLRSAIDFEAADGIPVRLIVYVIAPEGRDKEHAVILAAISRTLSARNAVGDILAAATPPAARAAFLGHQPIAAPARKDGSTGFSMLHIFVERTEAIDQVTAALDTAELDIVAVVDAADAGAPSSYVPLFAAFTRHSACQLQKVILAVCPKARLADLLATIEGAVGDLDQCSGVMVTAQDLSHVAGSLTAGR